MAERGFKFGLLNYAAVVADVLAECSIFSKGPSRLRYSMADAKKLIMAIAGLRDKCLALAKSKIAQLHAETDLDLLACCLALEEARINLEEGTQLRAEFLPYLEARPRAISKINQIALLWARGFVARSGILWEEAGELYYWFIKHFENESRYSELILKDFDIDSIKKLFARLDEKYYLLLQTSSKCFYFPTAPGPPTIKVVFQNMNEKAYPIVSVEFYSDRIMTFFESDKGVLARETVFNKEGPISTSSQSKPVKETPKEGHLPLIIGHD